MTSTSFGVAKDGQPPCIIHLTNACGMDIKLMDIGATWLSCRVPLSDGELREVLLGADSIERLESRWVYMGTTVGRYANRIAEGKFSIGTQQYQLEVNQAGNCLHGGLVGFDKRRWDVLSKTDQSVEFGLLSPDGDQGFPGNAIISVTYRLTNDNRVEIEYGATCDKATPFNMTNHAYFNLAGADQGIDVRTHILQVQAKQYIPTADIGIPLGYIASVEGTSFDFSMPKALSFEFMAGDQQQQAKGYDHCFVFPDDRKVDEPIATLIAPDQSVTMSVTTSKPGIQVYTGNFLNGAPNRKGGEYVDYEGIALETQFFPDSPNNPQWQQSNSILSPGGQYCHRTYYQFTF